MTAAKTTTQAFTCQAQWHYTLGSRPCSTDRVDVAAARLLWETPTQTVTRILAMRHSIEAAHIHVDALSAA